MRRTLSNHVRMARERHAKGALPGACECLTCLTARRLAEYEGRHRADERHRVAMLRYGALSLLTGASIGVAATLAVVL